MPKIIEWFYDNLWKSAKKKWYNAVLVPWARWAMSNYNSELNHIEKYLKEENKTSLWKPFNFNNYDITDNVYAVRWSWKE